MSDSLKLALTITAVDMFSGVMRHLRGRIQGAGAEAQRVRRDFDMMERSISRGVKAIAGTAYIAAKIRPGVRAASDLQESMLNVKQLLWQSGEGAGKLASQLAQVRSTATQVSANLPYSAKDLADIEANLLQGGVALNAVVGKHGAAFATAALSAVGKMAPTEVSESIAKIGHAFQLQGKEYGGAADNLARISSSSAADLGELLYNLRQAGPAAHSLNIPLKNTATALAAVSTLGQEAGTDLKQFFVGLSAGTPEAQKALNYLKISFFDKKTGNFIGLDQSIQRLRAGLGKVHSQQLRMIILQKLFQTQGAQAAMLLMQTGNKSYEEIKRNADAAAGLVERERIWSEGLNASMAKLGGTTQSSLANLFNPMLGPLREAVDGTNKLVGNIGDLAEKHKAVANVVSGGAGLAIGAGVAYGAWQLLKGGRAGLRVLRGMKGLGGGVAAGKALEAAAGVTPVYVVNMPSGGIGGAGIGDLAGAGKTAGRIARRVAQLRRLAPLLGGASMGELASYGSLGVGATAGGVGIAGAAGYGLGTLINNNLLTDKGLLGSKTGEKIGEEIGAGVAHVLAFFGNEDAKRAIAYNASHKPAEVHVRVEVEGKEGAKARVKTISSKNAKAQLDTAPVIVGGGL